jgi:hypothetical protein
VAHARLAQPLGQAVEVRVLALDQQLLGRGDVRRGVHRLRRVVVEHLLRLAVFASVVDQPGLPLGQVEGQVACAAGVKTLSRCRRCAAGRVRRYLRRG